jgi:hypothetical protein
MPAAEARIPTENASRYLVRLCRHAATPPEIRRAECSETEGTLILSGGQCALRAVGGVLTLRVEASEQDGLIKIEELIANRLEKFGRRERLAVAWQPVHPD